MHVGCIVFTTRTAEVSFDITAAFLMTFKFSCSLSFVYLYIITKSDSFTPNILAVLYSEILVTITQRIMPEDVNLRLIER
jgi:hypothetical protein